MIDQSEAHIGVVHTGQLKDWMTVAERVHINQQAFPVLKHDVLHMVVSM